MLNFRIQLLIERILSGSRSYLASHPELGVPLGVFNIKDEPTYQDRKKSIGKLGKEGNPLSKLEKWPFLRLFEVFGQNFYHAIFQS